MGEILGVLPSSMAILDGGDEIGIGLDYAGQFVAHDFDHIVARQEIGCGAVGHALLGQEHQRRHDQRHVMVPRPLTPDLKVSHATGALGILERALHEMPRRLHLRQAAQARTRLGVGQAELQFRVVNLPTHQEMPATRPGFLAIPQPHRCVR